MSNNHLDAKNHPMNNNHQTNHNHQNLSGGGLEGPQVRTLHDYLRIIYRYRWLVLSVFLLVSAGTVYHTFTKQPIYEASTTIMIQDEKDNMENLFGMPSMTSQKILNNQIEYLKSRTLAQNVIQTLENGPYADSLYTLETAGSPEANLLQKAVRLPFVVLNRISGNKTESGRPETYEGRIRRLASLLQGKIEVAPVQETDVIRIKYQAPSRQEAVLVANTIAKEYYEQNLNFARGEVNEVKRFLQDQLQTVNDNLFQAEVALKDYQQQTEAIALDQSTEQMVQQQAQFESQYNNTMADLSATETRIEYLKSRLTEQEQQTIEDITGTSTPFVEALRDSLAARQVKLTVMQTNPEIPPDHPVIQRIKKRIGDLREQLQTETKKMIGQGIRAANPLAYRQELITNILQLESERAALTSKKEVLEQMVKGMNTQLSNLPEKTLQLARLMRTQQVNEKLFMLLKTKFEETRITEAGQIGNVRIVDAAVPPRSPVKPNKKRNLMMGFLMGSMLGIGLALLLDYLDSSVKTVEDIERSGLKMLGMVPVIEKGKYPIVKKRKIVEKAGLHPQSKDQAFRIENQLVTQFDPRSPVSEAYRALRTSIQFANPERMPDSILITSAGPGEGKSTTAANLAITMAQMGHQTLLVDADLRRPMQHKIFHVPRVPGFTETIVEDDEEIGIESGIENLFILPSGELPPNPSEVLGSKKTKTLFSRLKAAYDKVIFDSPPVLAVTDAVLLSTLVDGALLVSFSGKTDYKALERAAQQLREVGCLLYGIVLNHLDMKNVYGHYYYNYHYYNVDGKRERRRRKTEKR